MAIIDFLDGVDPFTGSRRGVTFDVSQAGPTAKKRPSPVNRQTNDRMRLRTQLNQVNKYFWNLTGAQKAAWTAWGTANGITGPYGCGGVQRGCAAFFKVGVYVLMAGDPLYIVPPGNIPIPGANITNLVLIDPNTIRVTFNPSPLGADKRLGGMQTLPTAGARAQSCDPRKCYGLASINTTSPTDFHTAFSHLPGAKVNYYIGVQDVWGRRSILDRWEL